jgi:quercetin dioxygenase-like cupin family protein
MYMTDLSNDNILFQTRSGKKLYWLIPAEVGAPNFELRYVEIPPNIPLSKESKHPHEHEVFVVKGRGILRGEHNGKPYEVELKPGQAIFIPGNEEHQWLTPHGESLGIICVVPKGAEATAKPLYVQQDLAAQLQ